MQQADYGFLAGALLMIYKFSIVSINKHFWLDLI